MVKLTEWRGVRPQPRLCAPDDGLADEDKSVVADVLDGVAHQVLAGVQHAAVEGRQRRGALDRWKTEEDVSTELNVWSLKLKKHFSSTSLFKTFKEAEGFKRGVFLASAFACAWTFSCRPPCGSQDTFNCPPPENPPRPSFSIPWASSLLSHTMHSQCKRPAFVISSLTTVAV